MTKAVRSRKPTTGLPWRLGGAMILVAVATAVGAGGQPAFAAPKPAPSAASTADPAHGTRHQAGKSGSSATPKAATSTRSGGTGSAKAAPAKAAPAAKSAPAVKAPAATKAAPAARTEASPNAVTSITVAPSTTTAEITWDDVATATDYDVADNHGDACANVAAPAHTCTLVGLTADTTYTVTVTANMPTGTTTGTSSSFEVGAPDKPTGAHATLNADGSITADWVAPADVHAGIDHYTATATEVGVPANTATCSTTDETTTTCDIDAAGLDPSTDYEVTVVANGVDNTGETPNDSAASDASDPVTTPIGGPTAPIATPQADGTVDVSWTVPADTTGIDHYTATTSPAGGSCSSDDATPADNTCTIDSVDDGVVYTISVVAIGTADGVTSATSDPSAPFITGDLNPPTGVTATAGSTQAMVSWTAPAGAKATDLAYYTATSSGGQVCNTIDAAATSCTVTGLSNLTSYTFTVVAHSANVNHGDSAASAASNAVTPLPATVTLKAGANGKYVTAENAGNWWLIANRASAGAWETFTLTANADGTVSLMAQVNGKYVTAEAGGAAPLIANRSSIGSWEKFTLIDNGDGTFSLKSSANGKYVTAEAGGARALVANRSAIGAWEKFTIS
jgi:hypothetical protein